MKVLQICNKPLYPSIDGGSRAMQSIAEGLINCSIEVTTLCIATDKHPGEQAPAKYYDTSHYRTYKVNTNVNILKAFLSIFGKTPYYVKRFYDKGFARMIKTALDKEQYDIVHLESLFIAPYLNIIKDCFKGPVILRAHNIEHLIWSQRYAKENSLVRKLAIRLLCNRLKSYETSVFTKVNGICCISSRDMEYINHQNIKVPKVNIPIGINVAGHTPSENSTPRLFFVGAMDWHPNLQGLTWFLEEVWQKVLSEVPNAELHIAGKAIPNTIKKHQSENLKIHGTVADVNTFIKENDILISPIFDGGGLKIKVAEAMTFGKVIIGTTKSFEGIKVKAGINAFIANNSKEFIDNIRYCYNGTTDLNYIGKNAAASAKEQFDIKQVSKDLISFYKKLLPS